MGGGVEVMRDEGCGARVCGESAENGEGGGNGDEDKERNGCKRLIWEEGMVECVRVKRTKIQMGIKKNMEMGGGA